jgi:hypothetical protein
VTKIAGNEAGTYQVFGDMFYALRSNDGGTTFGLNICEKRNNQETLLGAVHCREIV